VNFGLTAAKALEDGLIDSFWANGMGTEVAVRSGAGKIVLDIRRGDGPEGSIGSQIGRKSLGLSELLVVVGVGEHALQSLPI